MLYILVIIKEACLDIRQKNIVKIRKGVILTSEEASTVTLTKNRIK